MMYLTWGIVALMLITGVVLLLFTPGLGIVAAIVLAAALIVGIAGGIARGASTRGTTPDIEERREEHKRLRRNRHRAH